MAINQVIDLQNRVVEYPNRYKLTQVAGTNDTYDLERKSGEITEEGTPYSRNIINKIDNVLSYLNPAIESIGSIEKFETLSAYQTNALFSGNSISYSESKTLPFDLINITDNNNYNNKITVQSWTNRSASGLIGTISKNFLKQDIADGIGVGRYSSSNSGSFFIDATFETPILIKSLRCSLTLPTSASYNTSGTIDLYNDNTKLQSCVIQSIDAGTHYQSFEFEDYIEVNRATFQIISSRSYGDYSNFNAWFTDFKIKNEITVTNLSLDTINNNLKNNQIIKLKGNNDWINGYSLNGIEFDKMINANENYELTYNQESNKFIVDESFEKITRNLKSTSGTFSYDTNDAIVNLDLGFTPDLVIVYDMLNNHHGITAGTTSTTFRYVPRIITKGNEPYPPSDTLYGGKIINNGFEFRAVNTGSKSLFYYIALKVGG